MRTDAAPVTATMVTAAGAIAALIAPSFAQAHGATADWRIDPAEAMPVLLMLAAAGTLYAVGLLKRVGQSGLRSRDAARAAACGAALLLLALALVWPLEAWTAVSFAAHMTQHMVLLALVPPLLIAARPGALALRALPPPWRRAVAVRRWRPVRIGARAADSVAATAVLHGVLIWGWHAPRAFEAAVRSDALHAVEHVSLLIGGLFFWRALLRARRESTGAALAWMLATLVHTGLLAALLTLAPTPLYGLYVERLGVAAALEDQQLAGLIMWVPMGSVYIVSALQVATRWLAPTGDDLYKAR